MKKITLLVAFQLLLLLVGMGTGVGVGVVSAQSNPTLIFVSSTPSGACSTPYYPLNYQINTGVIYGCKAGTWTAVSGTSTTCSATVGGGVKINADCSGAEFDASAWTALGVAPTANVQAYHTVQDEGTGLTQQKTINFAGAGVSCADDTTKTTCTIAGGSTGTMINWQGELAEITADGIGTDTTIYTTTIPANTLSTNKCVRINTVWIHSTGSAAPNYKLWLGTTSNVLRDNQTGGMWFYEILVCGNGATDAQVWTLSKTPFIKFVGWGELWANSATNLNVTSAEDSTGALTLKLTFEEANTDRVTPLMWLVEKIQ